MIPNAENYNPDYLRTLISNIGISQRAIARQIGVSERMFRQYITDVKNATYVECPYAVPFALESWAE